MGRPEQAPEHPMSGFRVTSRCAKAAPSSPVSRDRRERTARLLAIIAACATTSPSPRFTSFAGEVTLDFQVEFER